MGFAGGSEVTFLLTIQGEAKEMGLISELVRSSGEGNGKPLQDSCLKKSMDRGVWWANSPGD